jgi:hypothetical protein
MRWVLANAVARVENLEFLSDVVPKTTTYKQVKQKQAKDGNAAGGAQHPNGGGLAKGQGTLDGHVGGGAQGREETQATNGASVRDRMQLDGAGDEDSEGTVEAGRDDTRSPPDAHGTRMEE